MQISASTARQTLPSQLDRVEAGEEIEITRHGHVVAVLVSPASLATRRATRQLREADRIGSRLEAARRHPVRRAAISEARAEELIADIRAGREAR